MARIASVTPCPTSTLGGMQRIAAWLADIARRDSHAVDEISLTANKGSGSGLAWALIREPMSQLELTRTLWKKRSSYDLSILHAPAGFSTLPGITIHHVNTLEYAKNTYGTHSPMYWRLRCMNCSYDLISSKGAGRINIAVSKCQADNLTKLGIKVDHVIYNPIDCDEFYPVEESAKMELRRRLGLPQERLIALIIGRGDNGKNWLRVMALASKYPNVHFLFLGRDESKAAISLDNCHFKGIIPQSQVREYLQSADAMIHLSKSESCSLAVFEAMACGLPVLGTRVGALSDIARTDRLISELLLDPSNSKDDVKIASKLFEDSFLRETLGNRNRVIVNQVANSKIITEEYLSLMRQF